MKLLGLICPMMFQTRRRQRRPGIMKAFILEAVGFLSILLMLLPKVQERERRWRGMVLRLERNCTFTPGSRVELELDRLSLTLLILVSSFSVGRGELLL